MPFNSNLPELPVEVVSYMTSFIPIAINKQSRRSFAVDKIRHGFAQNLERGLKLYYTDDIKDYEQARNEGVFPPLDVEAVEFSCILGRFKETLRNIAEMILSECSNWDRFGIIEYDPYLYSSIRKNMLELSGVFRKLNISKLVSKNYAVYALL